MAVASVLIRGNHLHLTPDRRLCQHINNEFSTGPTNTALPDTLPTVSKNRKQHYKHWQQSINVILTDLFVSVILLSFSASQAATKWVCLLGVLGCPKGSSKLFFWFLATQLARVYRANYGGHMSAEVWSLLYGRRSWKWQHPFEDKPRNDDNDECFDI